MISTSTQSLTDVTYPEFFEILEKGYNKSLRKQLDAGNGALETVQDHFKVFKEMNTYPWPSETVIIV